MATRIHPDYYYAMRDEVIALMNDQAGKPFDVTNFRIQFRKVAAKHQIPSDSYQAHFRIIQQMVATKLPRMKPQPTAPSKPYAPAPAPRAWRQPGAFDIHLAQLPPSDRD